MTKRASISELPPVVPKGELIHVNVRDLKPSPHNPRRLFDAEPLRTLRESIQEHGVLVPLTVYKVAGQAKYAIVDGERRYRCCLQLAEEGIDVSIPANIVEPPDVMASLIYMFNIHQFRQQWELMPTALALKSVIELLGKADIKELSELTGLSERQVERCKIILSFPARYQDMSMDPDPTTRIPSNFWVELHPVLEIAQQEVPELVASEGRDGITDRLIAKYRNKLISSVIHFRRILEAFDVQEDRSGREEVADRLREYVLDPALETRRAFDGFIGDQRRYQRATDATDKFIRDIQAAKIEHLVDGKDELLRKLRGVLLFVQEVIEKLEGEDPPTELDD
jgi:ParB/RepB/Spo0J family partition protein